jgi:hypothetical protein
METDRIQEKPLKKFFESFGARSFEHDPFGLEWEIASVVALSDVRKCADKDGYEYMESGVSAAAGARSGEGSNGAGEFVLQMSSCGLL